MRNQIEIFMQNKTLVIKTVILTAAIIGIIYGVYSFTSGYVSMKKDIIILKENNVKLDAMDKNVTALNQEMTGYMVGSSTVPGMFWVRDVVIRSVNQK